MIARTAAQRVALLAAVLMAVQAAAVSCGLAGGAAAPRAVTGTVSLPGNARAQGPSLAALKPGGAVLVHGSTAVKGLPGFGQNALPALWGEYAYLPKDSASGDALHIPVWFTRERLLYPETWTVPACGTLPAGISALRAPAEADGSSLWILRADGYTILANMPSSLPEPCRFASVLTERFLFFQRYAERPEDASFPAILDIGR